jgi:predicted dienelactone hydrolase
MKKPHEVQQSELYLPESSSLYRYTKSFMLAHGAMPSFLAAPMAYVASYLSNFRLPAILHAPLLEGKQFPVVVFSHGLMGYRGGSSTSFLSDLASHGYIVAAVEHK